MAVRNIPDDVNEYWEKFIQNVKNSIDFSFRTWFVGFVEGFDNKAFVRKGFESVSFELKLPLSEEKVINYINENMKPLSLQSNVILTKKRISFKVTETYSLLKLICLFSGSIFLREYFHRFRFWVAVFRYLFDIHVVFFKKTIQNLPNYRHMWLTQTSWLSGLLDARSFFTKLLYLRSFNKYEVSFIEGKLIVPMKVSREIKLFETLSIIYGGKLKITESKNTRKFYYCLDIMGARELSFYIRDHSLNSQRNFFFSVFFDLMVRSIGLVVDRTIFGSKSTTVEDQERKILKDINNFNFELYQKNFSFNGELKEVWTTIFHVRAEKRAKARGGQYANFLEKKYEYVLKLKPKSLFVMMSIPCIIFYLSSVLGSFSIFRFFRKGYFLDNFDQKKPFYKYNFFAFDLLDPFNYLQHYSSITYFIDREDTFAKRRLFLKEMGSEHFLEAKKDFLFIVKNYNTVSDCEML